MNCITKTAALISKDNFFQLQTALFHATPVLERKRCNNWNSSSHRSKIRNGKSRRSSPKQSLLRNINAYAEYMFQSWKDGFDEEDEYGRRGASRFEQNYSKGPKRDRFSNWGSKRQRERGFQFCEDDDFEVETIFQSAFGGNQFFFWSFINDEKPRWRSSYSYSNNSNRNWRYQDDKYYDFSSDSESDRSESDLASDRLALGLSASGPLNLEDVKNAYRSCALKWHPDRHEGSSKAVAEEKFKLCSAAYQSLCDRLAAA